MRAEAQRSEEPRSDLSCSVWVCDPGLVRRTPFRGRLLRVQTPPLSSDTAAWRPDVIGADGVRADERQDAAL